MMKFENKTSSNAIYVHHKPNDCVFELGRGSQLYLHHKTKCSNSKCWNQDNWFDYHGYQNPMIGKPDGSQFTPRRFTVIQMR